MHTCQAYAVRVQCSAGSLTCLSFHVYLCLDLQRVQQDASQGDSPLWFGEWALSTQFSASDDFLVKWADAQKLAYSQGQGWIVSIFRPVHEQVFTTVVRQFWNFKTVTSTQACDLGRQW